MTGTMNAALLVLRLAIGLTMTAHGAQKLWGWFGGYGYKGMTQFMAHEGLRPAGLWLNLAILGEIGGGLSLALGLLTPLGAAGVLAVMFMAVFKTHWKNGFFALNGGYEYALMMGIACVAIGIAGPGRYSLDALLGIGLPEVALFGVLAVIGVLVDVAGIAASRSAETVPPEGVPPEGVSQAS